MAEIQKSGWRSLAVTSIALTLPAIAALPSLANPEPAELLPPNTAYTILLDMRQETWDQLNQYALFQQLQAQGVGAPSPGTLPLIPELAYEATVAPWVGDHVAMALLPLDNPTEAGFEDHEVMIAPIADPAAYARVFEDDLPGAIAALKEREPELQTVGDVEIYYWPPLYAEPDAMTPEALPEEAPADGSPSSQKELEGNSSTFPEAVDNGELEDFWASLPIEPGLAIAQFPEFLIAARSPAAIQTWLAQRPDEVTNSLAQTEEFLRTLNHPQSDAALAILHGDLAELVNFSAVDLALPDLPFNLPLPQDLLSADFPELAAQQFAGTVEALVYPQGRGLRVQARGYYNDPLLSATAATIQPTPTEVLAYIPDNSYGMVSGQNLAGFWQEIATTLAASEETRPFLEQARGFVTALTGLDLDQDVFGWMDRGFTVFLYPTSKTPLTNITPELKIGLGIALQTSDRPTAEATFASLDDLIANFDIAVESTTVSGQAATSWGDRLSAADEPVSFLGRTWVEDDTLLLTTSIEALADLAQLEPAQALPNAFRFSESTRDFPVANQGYLFINAAPIRALVSSFFPPDPEATDSLDFRQLMATVQALSGNVSFQADYAQVDGLLMLAPAESP
ncbi:DUF3352 domain-containing protein [Leptolyngbya iicbica]|uniref:DUF3352 domain-containing protein n=2 Tax=Cyanophyceae TaxID=3028117 RepID=A0A4Q7E1K0_9CYAN|nr:DUF3352 domain-containing protein [Leptolyngbya sp. LK]RZM75191.1 DUF3352 domain-containing protein [Leptolyngbya sp. LK]